MVDRRMCLFPVVGGALVGLGACASQDGEAPGAASPGATAITAARLEMGRAAYHTAMCFKCHGEDGTGTARAPNLTDGEWLHCDGSVQGILGVLRRGVPKSEFVDSTRPFAMQPATKRIHSEDELLALAQYVWSLSHEEAMTTP